MRLNYLGSMGAEDSDSGLPPSVFFTYRLEDREEHLSPQEVMAASELGRLYPFLGSNGVPQHINHASQVSQNLLRKQNLLHLDKQEMSRKEIDKSNHDYNELLKKLADAEARLSEADR